MYHVCSRVEPLNIHGAHLHFRWVLGSHTDAGSDSAHSNPGQFPDKRFGAPLKNGLSWPPGRAAFGARDHNQSGSWLKLKAPFSKLNKARETAGQSEGPDWLGTCTGMEF